MQESYYLLLQLGYISSIHMYKKSNVLWCLGIAMNSGVELFLITACQPGGLWQASKTESLKPNANLAINYLNHHGTKNNASDKLEHAIPLTCKQLCDEMLDHVNHTMLSIWYLEYMSNVWISQALISSSVMYNFFLSVNKRICYWKHQWQDWLLMVKIAWLGPWITWVFMKFILLIKSQALLLNSDYMAMS